MTHGAWLAVMTVHNDTHDAIDLNQSATELAAWDHDLSQSLLVHCIIIHPLVSVSF